MNKQIKIKIKRRADLILEKLDINEQQEEDAVPSSLSDQMQRSIGENEINKENIPHIVEQRKRKLSQTEYESDSSRPPSSSIIEGTPEKNVLLLNYSHECCDGKRMITKEPVEDEMEILKCTQGQNQQEDEQPRRARSDSSSSSSSCSSSSSSSSSCSSTPHNVYTIESQVMIDQPSTSAGIYRNTTQPPKNYCESPINSNESNADLSDDDPSYSNRPRSRLRGAVRVSASSSSPSSDTTDTELANANASIAEGPKKSRKRLRNPNKWKQVVAKSLRNTGQEYVSFSKSKKIVPARSMKSPCTSKCRIKCIDNITEIGRNLLFQKYWALGNIELQRSFIRNCMVEVKPKYKYTNAAKPRQPNNAFYFAINDIKIRVCKTFFINTLGICDRQIRTVKKKTDAQGFVEKDNRGKNENRKRIEQTVIQDIKNHINSIPRIESHYLRSSTSREYIGGEKTIKDLWRDFDKDQRDAGKPTSEYWLYYDIFSKEFNIGFFQPKKDRCDLCFEYELVPLEKKLQLKEKYDRHLKEKDLSRKEKYNDRINIDETHICSVFDLQAVMQCPSGDSSSFYYKTKLNCLNFTIVELLKKQDKNQEENAENEHKRDIGAYGDVYSFFWDETQGKRGSVEIGSCLLRYLEILNSKHQGKAIHVTFYSDNCCGQNKNKYIACLYSYAVSHFENIYSITQKYLIKGHTQNEGDNVHSLIEKEIQRNKKAGPIYAPFQYITLIKNSRKSGKPFIVQEVTYDFFWDLKIFQEKWAYNFTENENKSNVTWNEIKILKFCKEFTFTFYYKTSYSQSDFIKVNMRNKRKKMSDMNDIVMTKSYSQRLALSERKKTDLRSLIDLNLIPYYYADFYSNII